MKKLNGILVVLLVLVMTGCGNLGSNNEIEALNEANAVGSPFTQHLANEYRSFANRELDEMLDYPDALHFARKGLAAAAGDVVMPEPVSDWNLMPEHMRELGAARSRLITAFDLGAREIAAQPAAVAQAKFDCWIEQQEENWQATDILSCKQSFLAAMDALESLITPREENFPEPVEAVDDGPKEPMKPEDAMYLVFFDFDSSTIGAGGEKVLDAISDEIKKNSLNFVQIVGHTDRSGPNSYNNKLAMRRANAVRDGLVSRGVDAQLVKVESRGEDELLVQTPDDVREPANRRAEITFN